MWDVGGKDQFLGRMKEWENSIAEYERVTQDTIQESILLAVLAGRSARDLLMDLHAEVRTETNLLTVKRVLSDYLRANKESSNTDPVEA